MALTKEDLQSIGELMDSKLRPINVRLDAMQSDISGLKSDMVAVKADVLTMKEDIEQIKEDTSVTREMVNGLGDWTEIASDVLKIKYPV